VDDAGDVAKDGQQDVYQKICTATTLEEDTERWEDDGKDDLADVAVDKNVSESSSFDPCERCA
jgi:hypothetical protein